MQSSVQGHGDSGNIQQRALPERLGRTLGNLARSLGSILAWILRGVIIIAAVIAFASHAYGVLFAALILASVGFALVRTRLVSVDLFLNRSLVYSLLTVSLALIFFGSITVWELANVTMNNRSSEVGTVVSTLLIVALFQPLRARLQTVIDKRFYRHRYDAARVIAAFTATLREEIDLDQLTTHLLISVHEALLPESVSLWLCEAKPHNEGLSMQLVQELQNGQYKSPDLQEKKGRRTQCRMDSSQTTLPLTMEWCVDDPFLHFMQKVPDVVTVDHLQMDSPLLHSLQAAGIKIVLPLVSRSELVGLLGIGPRLSRQGYSSDDCTLLNTLAAQVAPALRVAQMVCEQQAQIREREQIEQELRTAQLIQRSLLPKALPELPGWRMTTYYQPAREVGGDLYDFLTLDDGRLGIVIGDAAGKGVPAALIMASTRSILRATAQITDSPAKVLERVNDLLCADTSPSMFVTCFYALFDPSTGKLRYANAGHDLPYQRSGEKVQELYATGMPLGMMPGMKYDEHEVTVALGEYVLFYSDGLVEAHNASRELFGFPRLKALLERYTGEEGLINFLLDHLTSFTGEGWEQEDDVTLVALQRMPERMMDEQSEQKVQHQAQELLLNWTVESVPGNERLAMERVAEVTRALLPIDRLARLKTAVAEVVMNAMEHGNRYQPDKVVALEVLASDADIVVRVSDQGEEERPLPMSEEAPDLEAKLSGIQTPRGWGLFLVEHLVDDVHWARENQHTVIELVMHRQRQDDENKER